MRGLLDLTDNIVDGEVVPPPATSCAATATTPTSWSPPTRAPRPSPTSPTASRPSTASGSATRSPRAARPATTTRRSAITARGAWECVKRHFRELGLDMQTDTTSRSSASATCRATCSATACCCSPHVAPGRRVQPPAHLPRSRPRAPRAQLRGARSGCSRCRARPGPTTTRSCSRPAAASSRAATKSIRAVRARRAHCSASPPTRCRRTRSSARSCSSPSTCCGTAASAPTSRRAARRTPQVGDRANDAVRVDGHELRCKVVGEGGNLGLSQLGRVEYALKGGRAQHRLHRQLGRRQLLRPRGQHQDPARRSPSSARASSARPATGCSRA